MVIKVKGHRGLIRDKVSHAIISTDSLALTEYKARQLEQKKWHMEMKQLKEDILFLKSTINELLESK